MGNHIGFEPLRPAYTDARPTVGGSRVRTAASLFGAKVKFRSILAGQQMQDDPTANGDRPRDELELGGSILQNIGQRYVNHRNPRLVSVVVTVLLLGCPCL
jgi:hypothetical protein